MINKFLFLILIISLASCGSIGKKVPNEATLQNQKIKDGIKNHSLMFEKVDGVELSYGAFSRPNKSSHYVQPGNRMLDLEITLSSDETNVVWAARYNINANLKSNEIYKLRASEKNWCIKMELVNSSGKVIAGPKFKLLQPYLSYKASTSRAIMSEVNNKIKNAKCT